MRKEKIFIVRIDTVSVMIATMLHSCEVSLSVSGTRQALTHAGHESLLTRLADAACVRSCVRLISAVPETTKEF